MWEGPQSQCKPTVISALLYRSEGAESYVAFSGSRNAFATFAKTEGTAQHDPLTELRLEIAKNDIFYKPLIL